MDRPPEGKYEWVAVEERGADGRFFMPRAAVESTASTVYDAAKHTDLALRGVIARFVRRITPRADLAYWNASTPHPPSLNRGFTPPALSRTSSVCASASEFATASRSQVTVGRTVAYRNAKASFQLLE